MVWKAGLTLTLTELVGDSAMKYAATTNSSLAKWAGHGSYVVLSQVLYTLLKTNDLAVTNAAWDTLSNIATLIVGVGFFGEKITIRQLFGIVLCFGGVYFLEPMNNQ
jgi:multidrug transporter EmrE-like cation transporter